MDKRLRRGLSWMAAMMVVLIMTLTYRQAFSTAAGRHPGNKRGLISEWTIDRGGIYAADGTVLAKNKLENGRYRRVYPQGEAYAAITGYYDPVRGRAGLESTWSDWLAGSAHFSSLDDWLRSLVKERRPGFDLTLTVDPRLQMKAWRLMAGKVGAVVVLEPRTGAVKALVSRPSYDPNLVAGNWDRITATRGLLVNRATQAVFPPGSTFKIITTAAALRAGTAGPASVYDGPAVLPVHGSKVTNFADQDQGRMTLARAFSRSTNTIFAQVGLELGAARLVRAARSFGIGAPVAFDLPAAAGNVAPARKMDPVMVAWTAVGQGETLVSPLQMSAVTAAVAANGGIFKPYIVEFARSHEGEVRYDRPPEIRHRPMDSGTAAQVKKMMVEAVESGTGRAAGLPDVAVAGKTGTAEVGAGRPPHAWFTGFAPAADPKVVVTVLVENGGLGGREAAPIAREIIRIALTSRLP